MKKFKIQSYRIGNKILYFSGKCGRTQANSGFVIAALLLITLPANTYITLKILVLTNWQYEENYLLNVFQIITIVIMEITSLVFFLICVYSDPGIIRKNLSTSDSGSYFNSFLFYVNLVDQPQIAVYQNQTFNLKFCTTCKIFRPIRGHHCKVCDVCIDILDHHCPWIANCVGYKNHKFFITLLHLITILCILLLIWSLFDLVKTLQIGFSDDDCNHVFNTIDLVISLFFAILSTFLAFSLIGFLSFHYQLILRGLTTYEKLKHIYEEQSNPFDQGCWQNCKNFFIGPSSVADGIDKEYLEQLSQPKPLFEKIMQASKEKMATFSVNQQGPLSAKGPVVKLFKTQEAQIELTPYYLENRQKHNSEEIISNNNKEVNKTGQSGKEKEKQQIIGMQLKQFSGSSSKNEIKTQNELESEMKTIPIEKNQQDINLEYYDSQYSSTRNKTVNINNKSNQNEQNETNLNNQAELQENYDTKMSEKKFGLDNILKFHMDSGDNVLLNFSSTRQTLSKESKESKTSN